MRVGVVDAIFVVDTANADLYCRIRGILRNGATAGTLIVRHRNETGSAVITVRAGSCGFLTTLP